MLDLEEIKIAVLRKPSDCAAMLKKYRVSSISQLWPILQLNQYSSLVDLEQEIAQASDEQSFPTNVTLKNPQTLSVKLNCTIEVTLTENDIFNWLTQCNYPNTLRYLANYARSRIQSIKTPDEDITRSL